MSRAAASSTGMGLTDSTTVSSAFLNRRSPRSFSNPPCARSSSTALARVVVDRASGLCVDELLDLLVADRDVELVGKRLEHELALDTDLCLGLELGVDVLGRTAGRGEIALDREPALLERARQPLPERAGTCGDDGLELLEGRRLPQRIERALTEDNVDLGLELLGERVADIALEPRPACRTRSPWPLARRRAGAGPSR